MNGISAVMNIACETLQANQVAMQVNSIANVNIPRYTRQGSILESRSPLSMNWLKLGMGGSSRFSGLSKVSQLLDQAISAGNTQLGRKYTFPRLGSAFSSRLGKMLQAMRQRNFRARAPAPGAGAMQHWCYQAGCSPHIQVR